MTLRIVYGSAYRVLFPLDGNVRNYTSEAGAHYVGDDTTDVVYYCGEDCLREDTGLALGDDSGVLGPLSPDLDCGRPINTDRVLTYDVEIGHDRPDYPLYCGGCHAHLAG